jgi:hypothetical protein
MIRMTAALLTLGVVAATASPAFAQGYGECFVAGNYCNPDAPYCRSMCWPRPAAYSQWQAPYPGAYPRQRSFYRHPRHHKRQHSSG